MKTVFLLSILTALTLHVSATIVRRQTGTCTDQQVESFLATLPQVCQAAIRSFTVNDLETICTRDCFGVYTQFIEETCDSPMIARVTRAQCSRGDATVDYCYPIVINQTFYNATRALLNPCGNPNTTCTPSCPAALQALAPSVRCMLLGRVAIVILQLLLVCRLITKILAAGISYNYVSLYHTELV